MTPDTLEPIPTASPPPGTAKFRSLVEARLSALVETHRTLFRDRSTCVLEIGCGHGHMLTAYAAAHPEKLCIGIDIIADRITRANRKRNRARLPNLHFFNASAEDFLTTLPEHVVISEIFVLFPDPWPKRRHHKNRLVQPEFLSALHRRVKAGSRLYFRTDDLPYFSAAKTTVATHPGWSMRTDPWIFEFATVFQERAASHHSFVAGPEFPAGR